MALLQPNIRFKRMPEIGQESRVHGTIDNFNETCTLFSMIRFKRNQIEEAISRLLEPRLSRPTPGLRTKLRRLLDTDRALSNSEDADGVGFAFFSAEPPGKGVEIWFSSYEAFALLNGLLLMRHGWPQARAVSIMRRVRPDLEEQHGRVLRHDPNWLFDQEAIRRNARPGDHAFDNQDPVLIAIVSVADPFGQKDAPIECKVCEGPEEAQAFFREVNKARGGVLTTFEVTTLAHQLALRLEGTKPRSRGRSRRHV
jgi:hypothetical protein